MADSMQHAHSLQEPGAGSHCAEWWMRVRGHPSIQRVNLKCQYEYLYPTLHVDIHTLSATLVKFKHTLHTCIYSNLRSHEELLICASKGLETSGQDSQHRVQGSQ